VITITKESILEALSKVQEPDLKKDLVSLNMIEDVHFKDKEISFTVILTTPACPLKGFIENACKEAIYAHFSKDITVKVNMISRVTQTHKNSLFPQIKNIVLVSSGKGGVGKSTISTNLALALQQQGAKVGLLDADIYGPSIPILMNLEGAKPSGKPGEEGKNKILPIEKYGIKILSIGFFTHPGQAIPWRGPMVSTAVKQLFTDADWGELDYLLVDLPPGTGDIHITIAQTFPITGALVITTPQKLSVADAGKGLAMFLMDSIKVPILGVIENMSYFTPLELPDHKYPIFGKNGGKTLAQQFEVPFLGEIPFVMGMSDSGDRGEPIMQIQDHPSRALFLDLSEKLAQQVAIRNSQFVA
jgi:ATP-binding protein involved in chromosome partitioning